MKPGLTPLELSGAASTWVSIDVVRGREVLALDLPIIGGEYTTTADREVQGEMRLTLDASHAPESYSSPISAYGQTIQATYWIQTGQQTTATPLGLFRIQQWNVEGQRINVKAADVWQDLADDPFPYPTSPERNATVLNEARRIAGRVPVDLAPGLDRPVTGVETWGVERGKALQELGDLYNIQWTTRPDGSLYGREAGLPAKVDTIYTGTDILLDVEKRGERSYFNQVTAWGRKNGDEEQPAMVATVRNNMPPYDAARYGVRTRIVQVDNAQSYTQVLQVAQRELRENGETRGALSVEIVPDPRLELGDTIAVGEGASRAVGRVGAFVLPFEANKPMRVDLVEVLA